MSRCAGREVQPGGSVGRCAGSSTVHRPLVGSGFLIEPFETILLRSIPIRRTMACSNALSGLRPSWSSLSRRRLLCISLSQVKSKSRMANLRRDRARRSYRSMAASTGAASDRAIASLARVGGPCWSRSLSAGRSALRRSGFGGYQGMWDRPGAIRSRRASRAERDRSAVPQFYVRVPDGSGLELCPLFRERKPLPQKPAQKWTKPALPIRAGVRSAMTAPCRQRIWVRTGASIPSISRYSACCADCRSPTQVYARCLEARYRFAGLSIARRGLLRGAWIRGRHCRAAPPSS